MNENAGDALAQWPHRTGTSQPLTLSNPVALSVVCSEASLPARACAGGGVGRAAEDPAAPRVSIRQMPPASCGHQLQHPPSSGTQAARGSTGMAAAGARQGSLPQAGSVAQPWGAAHIQRLAVVADGRQPVERRAVSCGCVVRCGVDPHIPLHYPRAAGAELGTAVAASSGSLGSHAAHPRPPPSRRSSARWRFGAMGRRRRRRRMQHLQTRLVRQLSWRWRWRCRRRWWVWWWCWRLWRR